MTSSSPAATRYTFKMEIKSTFKMSDLGLLRYYLGLEVTQSEESITVCQSAYTAKILEMAGLTGCNPSSTPMEPRLKLNRLDSYHIFKYVSIQDLF